MTPSLRNLIKISPRSGLIFEAVIISGCGLRLSSGGKIKRLTPLGLLCCSAQRILVLKISSLAGFLFIFLPNSCFTSWEFFHYLLFCLINKLRRERSILLQISDFLNILEMYLSPLLCSNTFYFAILSPCLSLVTQGILLRQQTLF